MQANEIESALFCFFVCSGVTLSGVPFVTLTPLSTHEGLIFRWCRQNDQKKFALVAIITEV
jgi:hypothetical protein